GLGGVPRGLPELEHDPRLGVAEGDPVAGAHPPDREPGLRRGAVDDLRARGLGQLEVPGEEVGVEVRLDHVADLEALGGGVVQVLLDVAARVDDGGHPGVEVRDQVARLGQAVQVVLREPHVALLPGTAVRHLTPRPSARPRPPAPPSARPGRGCAATTGARTGPAPPPRGRRRTGPPAGAAPWRPPPRPGPPPRRRRRRTGAAAPRCRPGAAGRRGRPAGPRARRRGTRAHRARTARRARCPRRASPSGTATTRLTPTVS